MNIVISVVITAMCSLGTSTVVAAPQTAWAAQSIDGSLAIASTLDGALMAITCNGTLMYGSQNIGNGKEQKIEIDGQKTVWSLAESGVAGVLYAAQSAGIRQLKKGYSIKFTNSNRVQHQFSLVGFTRAYDNSC